MAKPAILWEHKSLTKFNSFVIAPNLLLAAGQVTLRDGTSSFLSAINGADGSEVWREKLPAAVVKGGTAVDREARIFASLQDGRVLCFAAAEGSSR